MPGNIPVVDLSAAWLARTGQDTIHDSEAWYAAVRRLSPAVLGHELDLRRGADRKSTRVPNPRYQPSNGEPKTHVRKIRDESAVQHGDVARWPYSFRPAGYPLGDPIDCPTY